jgi:hypothetical protein
MCLSKEQAKRIRVGDIIASIIGGKRYEFARVTKIEYNKDWKEMRYWGNNWVEKIEDVDNDDNFKGYLRQQDITFHQPQNRNVFEDEEYRDVFI